MNQLNAPAISVLTQMLRNAFSKSGSACTVTSAQFRSNAEAKDQWQSVRFQGVPEFRLFARPLVAGTAVHDASGQTVPSSLSAGIAAFGDLLNTSLKRTIEEVDIESVSAEPEDLQISWRIEADGTQGGFEVALDGPSVSWAAAHLTAPAPAGSAQASMLDTLLDVELPVSILLASREASLDDVLRWGPGAVVEFDAGLEDPVDVIVNKQVVARGSVVLVDGNYGVRITEVLGGLGAAALA